MCHFLTEHDPLTIPFHRTLCCFHLHLAFVISTFLLHVFPFSNLLGPILFLIYINDQEDDISSKLLKFADDTKVLRKVTNDTDKKSLQDDLDKLVKWSVKWQILFNFGKCKCIHIGHGNMDEEYKMGD